MSSHKVLGVTVGSSVVARDLREMFWGYQEGVVLEHADRNVVCELFDLLIYVM